ncbi:MAG: L-threonylcarbamoyladenylate synthase [Limnohabitans sp.]|nr:L-threonylcarbamoyladenylate synthase [Limnohabitans sp.]
MPIILEPTLENITRCAERLRAGLPVAFPTETVYGLACDARSEAAVAEVYRMKRRPSSNPLIAHVTDPAMAKRAVIGWDVRAQKLADAFWPGPLAIILSRRSDICALSVGGRTTVAVRSPAHPVALALISAFGHPLSAPSANRSGRVSPTTAQHVADEFAEIADLPILDGGPCDVGLESTVLDLSRARPMILRPGAIGASDLEPFVGAVATPGIMHQAGSPGTSASHYAPSTATELVTESDLAARLARATAPVAVVACAGTNVPPPHTLHALPRHAATYAQLLYATMRRADASGADTMLLVAPPERGALWDAALDRMRRAAARRPTTGA